MRFRRPLLLAAVFGGFLVIVGALSVALAVLVSVHLTSATLGTTVALDRALVRLWADANLRPEDTAGDLTPSRGAELEAQLAALVERGQIVRIEVRTPGGRVLFTDDGARGAQADQSPSFGTAAAGRPSVTVVGEGEPSEAIGLQTTGSLLREYLPIVRTDGQVAAVVGIWRDADPLLATIADARTQVVVTMAVGALVAAAILIGVFRAAQRRLTHQGQALLETTRRDPLTGLLNHGAVVAELAERVSLAAGAGARLGVGLIDVDNFRLLNNLHGHAAGDAVLLEVSTALSRVSPAGTAVGRYGPDEFLIVGPPIAAEVVNDVVKQLQSFMDETAVQFGDSEQLPITISAGLATYPEAASGVTDLLVAVSVALGEAKIAGGGAIRSATAQEDTPVVATGFSVLQGLVLAINTKDRYTKRHSEDVARYALFLGARLGLSAEELEVLRVSGLLHDIGKVGIPDDLLRKPGRLTVEEQSIFHQHVALGDLIVRDLPHLHDVRQGVRHHHERWDGAGYLDGLGGEDIPLTARILAVADAFSAMTTTRPYRKALSVQEALKRLGDAAGSQLEERLAHSFITGMETAHDAPLPGDDAVRPALWIPARDAT